MLRIGIIGSNFITESFIDAARHVDGLQLAAHYSRSAERGAAFADKHGILRRFTDLEEMAASGELDAVYIASPNALHAEQAILFMKRGKHVLCEKPIASNSRELLEMIDASRQHGVLLLEAMKSTFLPNFAAIRDNLHRLGEVRQYFASFCQYSSRYDRYKEGEVLNAFKPELSNGSLMDIGVYCLYPLVALFGKPQTVQASAVMLESGVDGRGSLLLGYPGMEALIAHSKISDSSLPAEIQGEQGVMRIERISQPASVRLQLRGGAEEDLSRPQAANTMQYEIEAFVRLIAEGRTESDVNTFELSLAVMEVMDEARRQIGLEFPADRSREAGRIRNEG
ncbi:Gfo/Idh/MocA family oxidoreductase [Paenibacillus albicereus]|uniref:Gfo/Idh/MocA family oxidoreductase n=1 Tax=Paenibacillus albicereus TaxID=2726185 RepID=A0A6H2GYE6_9BACL|nr:Gfo/Idh/MocA family oxidoreductase [Paenibacillus albicereus]QJC52454.1 Gfo/Idh/MocA family oxidoreductase [Paenibacillus albicereus]